MPEDGRYDERLLLIVGVAGLALFALFVATPVLRPYYALLMPAVIGLGGGLAWALLRSGRLASAGHEARPASRPDTRAGREPET